MGRLCNYISQLKHGYASHGCVDLHTEHISTCCGSAQHHQQQNTAAAPEMTEAATIAIITPMGMPPPSGLSASSSGTSGAGVSRMTVESNSHTTHSSVHISLVMRKDVPIHAIQKINIFQKLTLKIIRPHLAGIDHRREVARATLKLVEVAQTRTRPDRSSSE